MRYFRATAETYEGARAAIDAACGYPCEVDGVVTTTSLTPAADAPHDTDGNVLLGLRNAEAEQPEIAPSLVGFAEITPEEYQQSIVEPSP